MTNAQKKIKANITKTLKSVITELRQAIATTLPTEKVVIVNEAASIGLGANNKTVMSFVNVPKAFPWIQATYISKNTVCTNLKGERIMPKTVNALEYYTKKIVETTDLLTHING